MTQHRIFSPTGLLALVLLLVLGAAVFQIVRVGYSDVVAIEARYAFDRWLSGKSKPDFDEKNAIQGEFEVATALLPGDPQLIEDIGRVYELKAAHLSTDHVAARTLHRLALVKYRRAAEARPTSPFAALAVASMKSKLGERDGEFAYFLGRAFESGPWQPRVQLHAIRVGLAAWDALPSGQQEQVRLAVKNQMTWKQFNQRAAIQALLKEFSREDLFVQ